MRVPNAGTVLGVIALAIVGVGIARAAIPDATGTYTGCFDINGTFRLIDAEAGANCQTSETKVTWPSIPRPGAAGPQGAAGAPGANGDSCLTNPADPFSVVTFCRGRDGDPTVPASAGVYDRVRMPTTASKTVATGGRGSLTATCPPGEVRVGRDRQLRDVDFGSLALVTVLEDRPTQAGQGWRFEVANGSGEKITMELKVRCAFKSVP